MLSHFEARLDTATMDEIGRTRSALARLARELSSEEDALVPVQMVRALEQLLFVEQRLRDGEVEREIGNMLALRSPDEPA